MEPFLVYSLYLRRFLKKVTWWQYVGKTNVIDDVIRLDLNLKHSNSESKRVSFFSSFCQLSMASAIKRTVFRGNMWIPIHWRTSQMFSLFSLHPPAPYQTTSLNNKSLTDLKTFTGSFHHHYLHVLPRSWCCTPLSPLGVTKAPLWWGGPPLGMKMFTGSCAHHSFTTITDAPLIIILLSTTRQNMFTSACFSSEMPFIPHNSLTYCADRMKQTHFM